MANKRSALKAARQAVTRTARNKPIRSAVKTYVKNARAALDTGAEEAADSVRQAVSQMDRAAQKGIMHRNAAARRKSRLMRRLHSLSIAGPGVSEGEMKKAAPAAKAKPARASATKVVPKTAAKSTKAAPAKGKATKAAPARTPAKATKSK